MKILIDQNISFRLLQRIDHVFPEATHVKNLNLINADDFSIFIYARRHGFQAVLTQDEDFSNLLLEHANPPKVIWLRVGNSSTAHLASAVLRHAEVIQNFLDNPEQDCLEIY
jgi:predicted nuclease of predicted toxin-antitoxin system